MDLKDQNFSQILTNSLSSDKTIRSEAERLLSTLASQNFPEFLMKLSEELSDENKPTRNRQMASLYFKNSITFNEKLQEIWINLDSTVKDNIKLLVLSTLASKTKEVRSAAGVVIAGICKVDQPLSEKWPTLIQSLCQNTYNNDINIRLAAIESLGFICEEMNNKTIDVGSVDSILTAFIENITNEIENKDIIKYILKAFHHTVPLASKNFSKEVIF
jgi:importin subunit beta-1